MTEVPSVDVLLRMSPELVEQLRTWTEPVQARLVATPGVGTGWEMELRRAPGGVAYPHRCPGCGNHFTTAVAATSCDNDHRAHAERLRR